MKTVNLAGEALPDALVEQIYATTNAERVYNLYGPTEDTTYSTYTLVRRGTPVTIGRPIANSQAYILDAHSQSGADRRAGRVVSGRRGTGARLLRTPRPDHASASWPIHSAIEPECADVSHRRSGALPCRRQHRVPRTGDDQVKIRGFRIELGEIETAAGETSRVSSASS